MNIALRIARRYLFAQKSTTTINIISGIAVTGLAIGTAALLLVLSVFNGFEGLLSSLMGAFTPELKITARVGKTFQIDSTTVIALRQLPGIAAVSETLEEVAFFEYEGSQDFGILKGVDNDYTKVVPLDSTVREGDFKLQQGEHALGVLGAGMRNKLSVNISEAFAAMQVYIPKQEGGTGATPPFRKRSLIPVGTFATQQEMDNDYVIAPLALAREMLNQPQGVSALEVALQPAADAKAVVAALQRRLGDEVVIKNRYQQHEAFMKIMNIEKWISFGILSLTLLLVAFNMIGSLWMIVLDKKPDIAILKSMGATPRTISHIFLWEGILFCCLGVGLGYILALLLYGAQKQYGIVGVPEGFAVSAYPIALRGSDFMIVALTVFAIGGASSLLPARYAARISTRLAAD